MQIEKHFAISPPEAGALVKCFGYSLLLIGREMCEEQQSGKSKYRPASIWRLSLDDRFRIKERAERTLNLPEWRPISALNRVSNRWPRMNERVKPSRSRRRLTFRDGDDEEEEGG